MLVVVGGHSRNIGKTSVVAGLIRRLRDAQMDGRQDHAIRPRRLLQRRQELRVRQPSPSIRSPSARSTSRARPIPAASWPPARNGRSGCGRRPANWPAPPARCRRS